MSYPNENKAKNLYGDVHVAQIADVGMGCLENHLAHRGHGWLFFFFSFFTLFYWNLTFSNRSFSLNDHCIFYFANMSFG